MGDIGEKETQREVEIEPIRETQPVAPVPETVPA